MTIHGQKIIYAGRTSDEFNVLMCYFDNSGTSSNDESTKIVTSKNPSKMKYDLHTTVNEEPLTFSITIAKQNGTYFDADEEEQIKKWLCKRKRYWLQVEQDDMTNKNYYCMLVNPRKVDVGRLSAGIQFEVICDSSCAWSDLKRMSYTSTNAFTFNFNHYAKFDDDLLSPTLIITPTASGSVTIKNNSTNKIVIINNCVSTEIITMDCENDMLESTNGRVMLDSWNKTFLYFKDGINSITLTGQFKLTIEYRLPVRIGG